MILCGNKTTLDKSVLLAHNNDLKPDTASLIQIIPAQVFPLGAKTLLKNNLAIPRPASTFKLLMLNCYYGFSQGDAVAVNRHQVSIAGGVALKGDRNEEAKQKDPLIKNGVSGHIRYLALQRAKTARECIKIIGRMYSKYGISYPSGVGVADPDEVWYMEAGGGKSWVAVKIPRNCYLAVANGYRIGYIDFEDQENFIYPSYLKKFLIQQGLWDPGKGPFHFARTFGQKRIKHKDFYNTRRIWRIQALLTPSLRQDPNLGEYPFVLKPDSRINLKHLFDILRDFYQDTSFDNQKYNNKERSIRTINTVHTDIIQLREYLPDGIGAVLWAGLGPSGATAYTPYYLGINRIPKAFKTAGAAYEKNSAFWAFRTLAALTESADNKIKHKITLSFEKYEEQLMAKQQEIEKKALNLYKKNPLLAEDFLTGYCTKAALKSLNLARKLLGNLNLSLK